MTQRTTGGNYLSPKGSNPYSKLTTKGRSNGHRSTTVTKSLGGASHFDTYSGYRGNKPTSSDRSKGHYGGYSVGRTGVSSFNRAPGSSTRSYTRRPTLTELAIKANKNKPWWK